MTTTTALDALDRLKQDVVKIRSRFPHVEDDVIGSRVLPPVPFYVERGEPVESQLRGPLSQDDVVRMRELGQWVNESAVVRLYGILHVCKIVDGGRDIDPNREGLEHVRIAQALRNMILKEGGRFKADKPDHRKLATKMAAVYGVSWPQNGELYPVPIDLVVLPMIDGCRAYVAVPAPLPERRKPQCERNATEEA